MVKQSDTTIIIPHIFLSKETSYALEECLKSLDETVPEMKKIVAINGTKFEDDFQTVKYPNVEFLVMERQGQCVATNAAVAMTNTPWVFITNNDMIYAPGWWEKLKEYVEHSSSRIHNNEENTFWAGPFIRCISPKLVEPRQGAPTFIEYFCGGAGGDFDKQKYLEFVNSYGEKGVKTGFNLPFLISRELWDAIGGYDINYDPWGSNSDSDLEYKIKLAGVQPFQSQESLVYHFSQTSGTFEPRNDEYRFKNYEYFKEKWGFDRTDDGIWEATFNIPTKEEGRIFNPPWENKYGRLS